MKRCLTSWFNPLPTVTFLLAYSQEDRRVTPLNFLFSYCLWPFPNEHSQAMSSNTHHPRAGGGNPEKPATGGAQNMAHLLRRRQEGKIPASAGGFVLGGHTGSRAASADLRSSRRGGGAPGFGFRRNVGQHPSLIERLRHTATLRGHSGEFSVAQPLLSVCLSVSMCVCLSLSPSLSPFLCLAVCISPPSLSACAF